LLGGSGFIGNALATALQQDGLRVIKTSRVKNWDGFIEFDLSVEGSLGRILESQKISMVINLVGDTSSSKSKGLGESQRKELFAQFRQSEKLLAGKTRLIHVGSGAEYGSAATPYSECSKPLPMSDYGDGKLEETEFFLGLADSGVEGLILRPSIIFGSSQVGHMLIPSAIKSFRDGVPFKVNHPEQLRDFLYVKDFAQAVLAAVKSNWGPGKIFNVGSGTCLTVGEFISELAQVMKVSADLFDSSPGPSSVSAHRVPEMNTSLIRGELDWLPAFDYKSAISDMVREL